MPDKTSGMIEYPLRAEGWVAATDHECAQLWRSLLYALGMARDATVTWMEVWAPIYQQQIDAEQWRALVKALDLDPEATAQGVATEIEQLRADNARLQSLCDNLAHDAGQSAHEVAKLRGAATTALQGSFHACDCLIDRARGPYCSCGAGAVRDVLKAALNQEPRRLEDDDEHLYGGLINDA